MNKSPRLILLLIFCILTLTACSKKEKVQTEVVLSLVQAITIQDKDSSTISHYPGKVDASEKVNLAFLVSGRLVEFPVHEGELIKKGQLVGRIDPKEFEIKVAQEMAKYKQAKITFERYKQLLPAEAISVSQYDEKRSLYELAHATLAEAQKNLDDTKLYAPFEGVVARNFVTNYQYVEAKQPIVTLQSILDLEVIINVPEEDILRAAKGKPVSNKLQELASNKKTQKIVGYATFTVVPNQSFPLTIKEVQTTADRETQTYKITLHMPMPQKYAILPGMTANVKISFTDASPGNIYLVPVDAVAFDPKGKSYVWLIDKPNMQVSKKIVKIGDLQGDKIQTLEGLKPGDTIVTAGISELKEGSKVKIVTGRIGR